MLPPIIDYEACNPLEISDGETINAMLFIIIE